MNWLLKKLGYRDRQYRGSDFSVRIEPMGREALCVIHTRQGTSLNLDGQRIGSKWEGIEVYIPREAEAERASQIAHDLEAAFQAMDYGYVIARLSEIETVPETERQAAIAELRQMGYELEISADRKQIRQKWIAGRRSSVLKPCEKRRPVICRCSKLSTEHASVSKSWRSQKSFSHLAFRECLPSGERSSRRLVL